jgi:nucleoside-diphosphate-sugar epimerase
MRVLIAGAGDLGLRVAQRLRIAGHQITAFSRSGGTDMVRADLARPAQIAPLVQGCDAIIFTAAPKASRNAESYRALYVAGLENLIIARTHQPILFCSSTAVYGENTGGWVDETTVVEPEAFNGRALVEAENLLRMGDIALRLSGIYGPGRAFARSQALAGVMPKVGHWTNRIHIDDAASALCFALTLPTPPHALNISDNQPCTQQALHAHLRTKYLSAPHLSAEAQFAPIPAPFPTAQPTGATGKRVSNARLREFGFVCRYQSFAEGYASFE